MPGTLQRGNMRMPPQRELRLGPQREGGAFRSGLAPRHETTQHLRDLDVDQMRQGGGARRTAAASSGRCGAGQDQRSDADDRGRGALSRPPGAECAGDRARLGRARPGGLRRSAEADATGTVNAVRPHGGERRRLSGRVVERRRGAVGMAADAGRVPAVGRRAATRALVFVAGRRPGFLVWRLSATRARSVVALRRPWPDRLRDDAETHAKRSARA